MLRLLNIPAHIFKLFAENGFIYGLCFFASYIYLTIRRLIWKQRMDVYDFIATGEPEKTGFYIPPIEKELELPKTTKSLKKFSDDVFVFGTNSKSDYLAVYIARLPENYVRCSVFLRLQSGRVYTLPKEHTIQKSICETNTFGSSRLKIQCLEPMRKWRVFFNGILEECTEREDSGTTNYKHMRFSFLWCASSEIFDYYNDMSKNYLSHFAASLSSWNSLPTYLLQKIHYIFNRYEQPGMLLGTLQVETEPEKEIYLWGSRVRAIGKISNLKNGSYTDILGNFYDGTLVHINSLHIPDVTKDFVCGFVMQSNGFVYPIDEYECEIVGPSTESLQIKFIAGKKTYLLNVHNMESKGIHFPKEFAGPAFSKSLNCSMNGIDGTGFIFKGTIAETERLSPKRNSVTNYISTKFSEDASYFIPLSSAKCMSSELCGGKGSSLGKLFMMSSDEKGAVRNKFDVPNGLIVTTSAYDEIIRKKLGCELRKFETDVWSNEDGSLKERCEKIQKLVREVEISSKVMSMLAEHLSTIFGDSYVNRKFAVRSSATGEDTEQMSAAGQMETFLGVKGIKEIAVAITKCWASQFAFQAMEYKKKYGQRLDMPMAVVIQEMVTSDVGGVIFTCDPVSANPSLITITANWGLGESVVSASAEPDTVVLERDISNQLKIQSITLGKKKSKTVMEGDTGIKEIQVHENESNICCLTDEQALRLGKIAVEIENEYGSPRDIEWGIFSGKTFLFQSRPITSIDIETEFEAEHFLDSAMRCENEVMSRAHVGEAFPGALSVLGFQMMMNYSTYANGKQLIKFDAENIPNKPYVARGGVIAYYKVFLNLISGVMNFAEEENDFTRAMLVAFFGRVIDTTSFKDMAAARHPILKRFSLKQLLLPIYILNISFFAGILGKRKENAMKNFKVEFKQSKSSQETLEIIASNYQNIGEAMRVHLNNTFGSTVWNSALLKVLASAAGEWDNKVYSDFAYLMSTCTNVESANVPAAIEQLAYIISKNKDIPAFKEMSDEEAMEYLKNDKGIVGITYEKFIKRHGHRCIMEFDVFFEVWETNPRSLIKTLQKMVNEYTEASKEKYVASFSKILTKLQIQFDFFNKLKLRWILPNARRCVRNRESSKAFVIKTINELRKACYHMADQMVREGRLQKKEHMFFLTIYEIYELSRNRSPLLASRASKRYKHHSKVNKLIFEEIITGIPKPINHDEDIPKPKGFLMQGVPVSRGVATNQARVVKTIDEASSIRQGDILITYSTDIAWSPYFPLLSGIVTELGGLISHGAVVAREYGLPCVVSLHGATRYFRTGDVVVLDGNKGTLQKID